MARSKSRSDRSAEFPLLLLRAIVVQLWDLNPRKRLGPMSGSLGEDWCYSNGMGEWMDMIWIWYGYDMLLYCEKRDGTSAVIFSSRRNRQGAAASSHDLVPPADCFPSLSKSPVFSQFPCRDQHDITIINLINIIPLLWQFSIAILVYQRVWLIINHHLASLTIINHGIMRWKMA